MGVMYGKVRDGTFWIMDAAALPVEGTETRVNAGEQVGIVPPLLSLALLLESH